MSKPEVMWKSCKSHQLELESELYKFRTSTGVYGNQFTVAQVIEEYYRMLFEFEKKLYDNNRSINSVHRIMLRKQLFIINQQRTCIE